MENKKESFYENYSIEELEDVIKSCQTKLKILTVVSVILLIILTIIAVCFVLSFGLFLFFPWRDALKILIAAAICLIAFRIPISVCTKLSNSLTSGLQLVKGDLRKKQGEA